MKNNNAITTRIYGNIKFLCTEQGIPVGKIENAIGVSPGYFARIKNSEIDIGICKIMVASEKLGVSIDDLVYKDIAKTKRKTEIKNTIEQLQHELEEMEND